MPPVVLDLILLGLLGGMTYALMSEGLWGSALMFFNALFAALISFNFYEPVAVLIVTNMSFAANFADSVSMMLLFIIPLLLLRLTTESIAPSMVRFPTPLYHLGRLVFGFGGSVITLAMLLLAYQASPVQKKMLGIMDFKYQPFYKARFDRDFLAFFQYTSGYTFARTGAGEWDPEFPVTKPMLFDPKGEWLIQHQKERPYGTEGVLEDSPGDTPAGGAPAGGAPQGPQQQAGPTGPNNRGGPGIPGGTAGAAAGLAPTNP